MEEDKTDADTEVQAGADRNSAEIDRGGRASSSVRKNSMTLDRMCPSIQIRTLF